MAFMAASNRKLIQENLCPCPASYSGSPGFESMPGDRLYSLVLFCFPHFNLRDSVFKQATTDSFTFFTVHNHSPILCRNTVRRRRLLSGTRACAGSELRLN